MSRKEQKYKWEAHLGADVSEAHIEAILSRAEPELAHRRQQNQSQARHFFKTFFYGAASAFSLGAAAYLTMRSLPKNDPYRDASQQVDLFVFQDIAEPDFFTLLPFDEAKGFDQLEEDLNLLEDEEV